METSSTLFDELAGQSQALRRLIADYAGPAGRSRLATLPATPPPLLLGMGASYHAALHGAHYLQHQGFNVSACEASEALLGDVGRLETARSLFYISQSGASAEVEPVLDSLPVGAHVTALTNAEGSPLARHAQAVLPLLAGDERTVATKTYANTLALLWLLRRHWTEGISPANFALLENVADCLAELIEQAGSLSGQWLELFASAQACALIGAGQSAITARHAAMLIMEWLKVPAVSATIGAFRHGPIEMAQPGLGAVVFITPGPAYDSSCRLAREIEGYGAQVLMVEAGQTRRPADAVTASRLIDNDLAPILDVVPVQIFVEALARERRPAPGFRHIQKVVTAY